MKIQELAEFWDSHDLTDFKNQLEEVKEPSFERKVFVKIDLKTQVIEVVEEMARQKV
jgi:hypothetical protein